MIAWSKGKGCSLWWCIWIENIHMRKVFSARLPPEPSRSDIQTSFVIHQWWWWWFVNKRPLQRVVVGAVLWPCRSRPLKIHNVGAVSTALCHWGGKVEMLQLGSPVHGPGGTVWPQTQSCNKVAVSVMQQGGCVAEWPLAEWGCMMLYCDRHRASASLDFAHPKQDEGQLPQTTPHHRKREPISWQQQEI